MAAPILGLRLLLTLLPALNSPEVPAAPPRSPRTSGSAARAAPLRAVRAEALRRAGIGALPPAGALARSAASGAPFRAEQAKMAEVEQKKKRTFRKFTYRGVDLDQLLDMSYEQLMQLYSARQRRRLNRGLRRKQHSLLKRLRKAKKEAPPMEKPEMVGSMVGVYNGKTFNQVEIKPEMIGHYLGEFSITYKPVKHGRPGIGATHSSRFIPLK
uniref:40S ribosomal protein S15 n=5 Tax=Amniota TaxID=32524 RepID=A0A8V1A714_CHICK